MCICRYYVSIFLGGEWGETDFTVGGKLVCIALVAIGIELYAIPISVLFDAFQDVLGKWQTLFSAEVAPG